MKNNNKDKEYIKDNNNSNNNYYFLLVVLTNKLDIYFKKCLLQSGLSSATWGSSLAILKTIRKKLKNILMACLGGTRERDIRKSAIHN